MNSQGMSLCNNHLGVAMELKKNTFHIHFLF